MKRWIYRNLILLFIILSIIGIFNYIVDPLWTFSHKNNLQNHQEGFDERQQKLNQMYFNVFDYDGVILGSSRVTLHDVNSFYDKKIFNLAVDGMRPYEYNSFIEYAKKINKKNFKYIILGLDFISIDDFKENYSLKNKIELTESLFYKYKMLFSYDSTKKSIRNINNTKLGKYKKRFKTYNKDHIASSHIAPNHEVEKKVLNYIKNNDNKIIKYNRNSYISDLKEIIQNNPESKIIVFTTPLPSILMKSIFKIEDNRTTYLQWISDLLEITGEVYSFFNIDDVSKNYVNTFMDSGHYYPSIGNCINKKIFDLQCDIDQYKQFGILFTKDSFHNLVNKEFNNMDNKNE